MSWTSGDTPSFAGSPLLRESPPFHSHTGPGGADLSLSELYISDRSGDGSASKPFSLLPQRDEDVPGLENEGDPALFDADDQLDDAEEEDPTVMDKRKRPLHETRTREERLQHDLFVLRKLNMSFSLYNDALKDTRSSTELDRTDRLLDQYVNLLKHTEKNAKLILDKTWEGGASDQARLEQLRVEAAQKAKREREERERATQLEQERLEKEERERKAKEDKDARDRDKRKPISVRGVRGRGTGRVMTTGTRGRIASDYANTTMRGASDTSGRGSTVSRGVRRT
ncbi:hypothetical protein K439DRAFT_1008527 [Ramaria rubella]|nr:hypothetical protein K439DRAFT_1008527 [Ramaria rubella]